MPSYELQINGQTYTAEAEADMPLLWVLRDLLGLTGTKFSCGAGLCGSCTVLIDGEPVRSCITRVENMVGKEIVTIEGLSPDISHPLQIAWLEERVTQCGYCQPGQIMNAAALLRKNPDPTDAQIDAAMSSVLCRCGTYQRVRKAIHRAAEEV
jgi:isoquinoline 1-oxidoreductase alpha subunit